MVKNLYTILLVVALLLSQYLVGQTKAPLAKDDYDTAEINTPLKIKAPGVLKNDLLGNEDDVLKVKSFIVDGLSFSAGETAKFTQGSLTINEDGAFNFIPAKDYTGNVPVIEYTISNEDFTSTAALLLTVEHITDLLEVSNLTSCNQGYTVDGEYKIQYSFKVTNKSTARDYHEANLIKNIDITNNLQAIFGSGCVTSVSGIDIFTSQVQDFINRPYPREFNKTSINEKFETIESISVLNNEAIKNNTLYPRQSIKIIFCVTVKPFCNGRPNPTHSGSGINFNNVVNATSSIGNSSSNLILKDFHTTDAIVTAGLAIPEVRPAVNIDGTYDYTNTVVIKNEGKATAKNVNYNMGLASFLNNRINFKELRVKQISGPTVTINTAYDGDTNTELLLPNNSLPSGETIVLEVFSLIAPNSSSSLGFAPPSRSQTQGGIDGFDNTTPRNKRIYSFVTWSDNLGNHLDRFYPLGDTSSVPTSRNQCSCENMAMSFTFTSSSKTNKIVSNVNDAPNGILEHQEVTFQITITNTSGIIKLENLQLEDNLESTCNGGNILSISKPFITNSTATSTPVLNTNFNGITDINFFNGTSGVLEPKQSVTVQLTVLFNEDCSNLNVAKFFSKNPLNQTVYSIGTVNVDAFTDTDNDGISNFNDIDDDNDTIPDIDEYNGLNPLDDHDGDFIPNYRDTDFGVDANKDGIVDIFDFDNDGVPNHLDLDSDNDGILDIVEAGNLTADTDEDGKTNNPVGANGLDNTVENNDGVNTTINYNIPNTDGTGNYNFLDIDADGDGIVDNIEGQPTNNYIPPNNKVNSSGIDTAYPKGIKPVDTDGDTLFDYVDTNSDNDIRDDYIEGWDVNNDGKPEIVASNSDKDNDGLDDAYDNNDNMINPSNGQTPNSFPNVDNTDNPERDWREIIAIVVYVNNVTVEEGKNLVFTISLVTKNNNSILIYSASPINIDFSSSNGGSNVSKYYTATAPFDYNEVNTTFTVPPYQDTAKFTVTSLEDNIYELKELFTLNGTITSNNTINTKVKGIGTIIDNDLPPSISMNNYTSKEGVDLEYNINISHPSSTPVKIAVSTTNDTAKSPDDYTRVSKTLTIEGTTDPNNANTKVSFNVPTIIDNLEESDEEYLNVIGKVTTNNIASQDLIKRGTILDIDPKPIVEVNNPTATEGDDLIFTIRLLNANLELMRSDQPIHLDLRTIDGTAKALFDYNPLSISTTVPAYKTHINQFIKTVNDDINEKTETMELEVTITSNNVSNSSLTLIGTGTIKDDDIPNLFSPNGDGKSDVFKIYSLEEFPNFKLKIFDRWGSVVYDYSNKGNKNPDWWDGTYNGEPVPEGVYYYFLDFNNGARSPVTNFIELVR